jgi:hypothetical protein
MREIRSLQDADADFLYEIVTCTMQTPVCMMQTPISFTKS